MALKDVLKISRKTFFNPRAWLGYDTLKESTQGVYSMVRGVFRRPNFEAAKEETFDQAVARLQLTEQDLKDTSLTYLSYVFLFILMALGLATYAIWLILHEHISSFTLCICLTGMVLGQAFRFHFLYFQIKHRKLGCTFSEWRSGKTNNEDSK